MNFPSDGFPRALLRKGAQFLRMSVVGPSCRAHVMPSCPLLGVNTGRSSPGSVRQFMTRRVCQTASKFDPVSASNFGSDLLLMKFAGCDVLISGENQHHASIVAAILIGTRRFCC